MPHRTLGIWIGLMGVLAVAALLVLGRNLDKAASTGPRWKRRLVAAGLALLALLGYQPAVNAGRVPQRAKRVRPSLAKSQDWQWLMKVYRHAEKVAKAPRFSHPFGRAEKQILLADLAKAKQVVTQLQAAGLLTASEARLLVVELTELKGKVGSYRPKPPAGRRGPTCYKPAPPPPPFRRSVIVLTQQVPLLKKLARQGRLHPEVLDLVKSRIERDIANAETARRGWWRTTPKEISKAKRLGKLARSLWKRVWRRVHRSGTHRRPPEGKGE